MEIWGLEVTAETLVTGLAENNMTIEPIVITQLDRIEGKLDRLDEKVECIDKTALTCEVNLTNHLTHHNKIEKYIMYPLILAAILAAATFIWGLIIK